MQRAKIREQSALLRTGIEVNHLQTWGKQRRPKGAQTLFRGVDDGNEVRACDTDAISRQDEGKGEKMERLTRLRESVDRFIIKWVDDLRE